MDKAEIPQELEANAYAAVNKKLPDGKTFPVVFCFRVETALKCAQAHYEGIIAEKDREIAEREVLLKTMAFEGDGMGLEISKLKGEIERITELLRNVVAQHYRTDCFRGTGEYPTKEYEEKDWQYYKNEHNIKTD